MEAYAAATGRPKSAATLWLQQLSSLESVGVAPAVTWNGKIRVLQRQNDLLRETMEARPVVWRLRLGSEKEEKLALQVTPAVACCMMHHHYGRSEQV